MGMGVDRYGMRQYTEECTLSNRKCEWQEGCAGVTPGLPNWWARAGATLAFSRWLLVLVLQRHLLRWWLLRRLLLLLRLRLLRLLRLLLWLLRLRSLLRLLWRLLRLLWRLLRLVRLRSLLLLLRLHLRLRSLRGAAAGRLAGNRAAVGGACACRRRGPCAARRRLRGIRPLLVPCRVLSGGCSHRRRTAVQARRVGRRLSGRLCCRIGLCEHHAAQRALRAGGTKSHGWLGGTMGKGPGRKGGPGRKQALCHELASCSSAGLAWPRPTLQPSMQPAAPRHAPAGMPAAVGAPRASPCPLAAG